MSAICKHCVEPEDKQNNPGLFCDVCKAFVHVKCLDCKSTPGGFSDDVFFDYTCSNCSYTKGEYLRRNKFLFTWLSVIYLTIHHLTIHAYGISNYGFFHYKTHIASFIDRHWNELFEASFKQKKSWIGTIAGKLSSHSGLYFRSGLGELGESGWWKLEHDFSPAVAMHIAQETAKDKSRARGQRSQAPMDRNLFIEKVIEMGYGDLINDNSSRQPPAKKMRLDSGGGAPEIKFEPIGSVAEIDSTVPPTLQVGDMVYMPELLSQPTWMLEPTPEAAIEETTVHTYSDTSSVPEAVEQTDSRSVSPHTFELAKKTEKNKKEKEPKEVGNLYTPKTENLFSSLQNSMDMPWMRAKEENKDLVPLSEYEEIQLLKQVEGMIGKVTSVTKKAELRRFRAKLAVRRIKRHKRLPVFDFDETVRILGGYVADDVKTAMSCERVLDRFQRSYVLDSLTGTVPCPRGATLVSNAAPRTVRSPYSGTVLAPYIRRDAECTPLWVKVMEELLVKTNSKDPSYRLPARATLDYSYVRPEHVAAVNSLCEQHFWPGIDLTEALQYPEFSCVVTYRQLVVACGFLVPDVTPTDAYISFVVTRPEWRNAKIATFMLYHLLQTCSGKDVTLHVSPTNPAIFLYQKFGFKVEELIQDFYEKYYDVDYKGCRHALFLRLIR